MFDVFIMDMGGHDDNIQYLRTRLPHAKIVRWTDHLSTVRRCVQQSRTRYCWIIGSCVDYTGFDFLWEPTPWQSHQVHCWPSGQQQFGDTFLIPKTQWLAQEQDINRLEDYRDVNFEHSSLPRLSWQRIDYRGQTVPEVLATAECQTPYVWFANQYLDPQTDPWLWREQPVVAETSDNGCCLIPRTAHGIIQEQVYDYPWLTRTYHHVGYPLDVVFISNGEHGADYHWEYLITMLEDTSRRRVHRINGINGRAAAYRAAAEASTTDWFFAVFAKLQVNEDFDWSWQPDRWQRPKHYIFHAYNPVNDLVYGHQAMIAYNKKLVLENPGTGLDFTLDQPHEVVPVVSGTAYYDNDPWTCWRTAFRECIKLKHSLPDVENEYRLNQWLYVGHGSNGHWSTRGAQDAIEYYEKVSGNFGELKKTYEWDWLASYALLLHPELFTASST